MEFSLSNIGRLNPLNASLVGILLHLLLGFWSDGSGSVLNQVRCKTVLGSIDGSGANTVVGSKATAVDIANTLLLEHLNETKVLTKAKEQQ